MYGTDEFDLRVIPATQIKLRRTPGGELEVEIDGDEIHPSVTLYRSFPLSRAEQYISLRGAKGKEIGLIPSLEGMDPDSLREAEQELRNRYTIAKVTAIKKIENAFGTLTWDLETERGPRRMVMRGLLESVRLLPPNRLLLNDLQGNRAEISDIDNLDPRSRAILDTIW